MGAVFLLYIFFAPDSNAVAQAQDVEQFLAQRGHPFTHPVPNVLLIEAMPGTGALEIAEGIAPMLVSGYHIVVAELNDNRVIA
ncbi:MAG TPA: hypothetical protein VGF98_10860 [Candidatus Tumulicola sp.]|jgi:hypothetical protein